MIISGDFVIIPNKYGRKECYRISSIIAIHYDDYLSCYTILFRDGEEVDLDLSIIDVEKLISLLVTT